jgi:hypothetical protein
MNKPHKHAEVIKAWADGKEVEYLSVTTNKWELISGPYPSWIETREYRIKPEPKKVWVRIVKIYNRRLDTNYTIAWYSIDEQTKTSKNIRVKEQKDSPVLEYAWLSDWVEITLNE